MPKKNHFLNNILLLSVFLGASLQARTAKSQALKILATDTFIGTFNGALLGAGTMALSNKVNVAPIRFGVGMGTLYGMGIGIADITQMHGDQPYEVNGSVSSAGNSAQVILMDTFFGGIAGSLVGLSISLIGNQKVSKGLQYGMGAGVWAGFGFGVVDAFYFGKTHPLFGKGPKLGENYSENSGLIHLSTDKMGHFSFVNPIAINMPETSQTGLGVKTHLGMEVAHWRISL